MNIARRARRRAPAAAAAVLGAAALLGGTAAGTSTASAATVPVAYGVPYGHTGSNFVDGKVRPTGLLVWTGDGSAWLVIHSYSSWSSTAASGSATVHVRSCWGSCHRYKTEHADLRFYRVRTHDGQPYFTRLRFSLQHKVAGLGSSTLDFFSRGIPAWYY